VYLAVSVGCVLNGVVYWECVGTVRETKGLTSHKIQNPTNKNLTVRKKYVKLKFRFKNIFTEFQLQWKIQGNICYFYAIA
jgi:hypothetical protein